MNFSCNYCIILALRVCVLLKNFISTNFFFFVRMQETKGEKRWVATPLGKACLGASMPPEEGLFLFQELQKARRCFVLDTELHIIYLVTPYSASSQIGQIDWTVYLDIWQEISESERRVGELIGVEERFLVSALRGMSKQSQKLVRMT